MWEAGDVFLAINSTIWGADVPISELTKRYELKAMKITGGIYILIIFLSYLRKEEQRKFVIASNLARLRSGHAAANKARRALSNVS